MTKDDIRAYNEELAWRGVWLTTYAPGDGVRRYALVDVGEWCERHDCTVDDILGGLVPEPDYFGGVRVMGVRGSKAARIMVEAYIEGANWGLRNA